MLTILLYFLVNDNKYKYKFYLDEKNTLGEKESK